jgi:hypothetical protein
MRMTTFALKLSIEAIDELNKIAQGQHIPTRTMVRSWIMQRLDGEKKALGVD